MIVCLLVGSRLSSFVETQGRETTRRSEGGRETGWMRESGCMSLFFLSTERKFEWLCTSSRWITFSASFTSPPPVIFVQIIALLLVPILCVERQSYDELSSNAFSYGKREF
mmetsp:Transcript_29918/g.58703  ORF Transcript_29918/g.58703 Transcript_29918/m.58703 type:complete len:111 (+) Transcript_29918:979-1311(+)